MEATVLQRLEKSKRKVSRDHYILVLSMILLVILVAAFTRSLYLRPAFDLPPLSTALFVHGVVLSLWYLWLFVQTTLVTIGRRNMHRRVGMVGAALAAAVVVTGVAAILGVVPRMIARGESIEENMQLFAGIFWGNGGILAAFAGFVTTAIVLRRHPAAHKRLMILASIAIAPPALHRVGLLPFTQMFDSREVNALALTLAGLLCLLLSLVLYDLVTRGRLHPATAWGVPGYLAGFLVCIFVVPGTALGQMTAEWLVRSAAN